MPQQWYCQIMGSDIGPFTPTELREMVRSGQLTPDALIRKADSERWTTAENVKGLFATPAAPPAPPPQSQLTAAASRPRIPSISTSNAADRSKTFHQQIRGRTDYVSQNLMPDETILYAASIHPLILFPPAILFLCFFLGPIMLIAEWGTGIVIVFILLGLSSPYFAIKALIILLTTECVLTDRRVLAKTGLISRESIELLLGKVEGLQVKQGILGRIFNFGTIIISGTGGSKSPFRGITEPLHFRKRVQEQIGEVEH